MNPVAISLVKTFNDLVTRYNNGEAGINFLDLTNLEKYIADQGYNLNEVNEFLNA